MTDLDIRSALSSLQLVVRSDSLPTVRSLVSELCSVNAQLWDTEDGARHASDDMALAAAKREIDRLNLERNHLIEQVDEVLACGSTSRVRAAKVEKAPVHTETVGSVVDRLVILALRVRRTKAASTGDPELSTRIASLDHQYGELSAALAVLIEEVAIGTRRLPDGRRFKLYGAQRVSGRR